MSKGFKWKGFKKASNNSVNVYQTDYVIYAGNFFMELILPNALKITSFKKLKERLDKYEKSHGGKLPQQITVNHRQRCEYEDLLFLPDARFTMNKNTLMSFEGIPLIPHNAKPRTKSRRLLNTPLG